MINIIPDNFALEQTYLNPFNPVTQIQYALSEDIHVELIIYDILGRAVRRLVRDIQQPGFKIIKWNGKDDAGRNVSAGVYFCRLQAGKFQETIKIAVVK